jgi:glycerate 2-kinase
VPDAQGVVAAEQILELVTGLTPEDLVICLISGGGSSLLALPAPGIALADKVALTRDLLRSGARIDEINAVRKHLSRIKGGRLATQAFPARIQTLAISDVPGDDPATIASGPTVADPTSFADARAVIERYRLAPPAVISAYLEVARDETPKPGDPRLARSGVTLIARPADCLEAAAALARSAGVRAVILGDAIEGDAHDVARSHAEVALRIAAEPGHLATVLLSGGETTVPVRGSGRGGRNAEFALALALALEGAPGIHALAADTDGIDGTEDNAGAAIDPSTLARARGAGLDPTAALQANDAYTFFQALGDLVVTGPTLTNVNDFRAVLIDVSG